MSATLSIPADEDLELALKKRAEADGKTVSEVAREILSRALLEPPLARRIEHLKGTLDLPTEHRDPWRSALRSHNWRP